MPAEDDAAVLDSVLEALANPHRREIVYVLGLQPCAISQLARMRGLSLPAIHKHIKILENAGLVSRRKTGRTTYLILSPRRLRLLQDWAAQFRTYWGSDQASFENYRRPTPCSCAGTGRSGLDGAAADGSPPRARCLSPGSLPFRPGPGTAPVARVARLWQQAIGWRRARALAPL